MLVEAQTQQGDLKELRVSDEKSEEEEQDQKSEPEAEKTQVF